MSTAETKSTPDLPDRVRDLLEGLELEAEAASEAFCVRDGINATPTKWDYLKDSENACYYNGLREGFAHAKAMLQSPEDAESWGSLLSGDLDMGVELVAEVLEVPEDQVRRLYEETGSLLWVARGLGWRGC